jgi:hypothetical protein
MKVLKGGIRYAVLSFRDFDRSSKKSRPMGSSRSPRLS